MFSYFSTFLEELHKGLGHEENHEADGNCNIPITPSIFCLNPLRRYTLKAGKTPYHPYHGNAPF